MNAPRLIPDACRWIAFDAVGTLIHPDPPVGQVYLEAARREGSRLTLAEITSRFSQAFRDTERNDLDSTASQGDAALTTNEPREYARWRSIVHRIIDDVDTPEQCFEELFTHFARPASWKCFDDTEATLAALRQRGYRLLLASNFDARLHAVCKGLPALTPIESCLVSSEVGHRKPSPRFFAALLEATGCRPEEVLMVGDDYENDLVGARDAGIPAILIDRRGANSRAGISSLSQLLNAG